MAFLAGLTSSALYLGLRNIQSFLQLMVLGVSAFIVDPQATKGMATHCGVDVHSVLSAELKSAGESYVLSAEKCY